MSFQHPDDTTRHYRACLGRWKAAASAAGVGAGGPRRCSDSRGVSRKTRSRKRDSRYVANPLGQFADRGRYTREPPRRKRLWWGSHSIQIAIPRRGLRLANEMKEHCPHYEPNRSNEDNYRARQERWTRSAMYHALKLTLAVVAVSVGMAYLSGLVGDYVFGRLGIAGTMLGFAGHYLLPWFWCGLCRRERWWRSVACASAIGLGVALSLLLDGAPASYAEAIAVVALTAGVVCPYFLIRQDGKADPPGASLILPGDPLFSMARPRARP